MIISRKRYEHDLLEAQTKGAIKERMEINDERKEALYNDRLLEIEKAVAEFRELEKKVREMELQLTRLKYRCDANAGAINCMNADFRARILIALDKTQSKEEEKEE